MPNFPMIDAHVHLYEAREVVHHDTGDPRLLGIAVFLPIEKGAAAVSADLAKFVKLRHACGVRRLIQDHDSEPEWALQEGFVEASQSPAAQGLTFDLCIRHSQIAEVTRLVRRCPDVRS